MPGLDLDLNMLVSILEITETKDDETVLWGDREMGKSVKRVLTMFSDWVRVGAIIIRLRTRKRERSYANCQLLFEDTRSLLTI